MYNIGDKIVYGSMGVCTVKDICVPDMAGCEKQCYVLLPEYVPNSKVYAPVENNPVNMRPILSAQQADELIQSLPDIQSFGEMDDRQQQSQTFRDTLKSTNSFMLARLLKTLYEKKRRCIGLKKNFAGAEKDIFSTAEMLFFGEISAALDIPMAQVQAHIQSQIDAPELAS